MATPTALVLLDPPVEMAMTAAAGWESRRVFLHHFRTLAERVDLTVAVAVAVVLDPVPPAALPRRAARRRSGCRGNDLQPPALPSPLLVGLPPLAPAAAAPAAQSAPDYSALPAPADLVAVAVALGAFALLAAAALGDVAPVRGLRQLFDQRVALPCLHRNHAGLRCFCLLH